jgi:hypothetical protein
MTPFQADQEDLQAEAMHKIVRVENMEEIEEKNQPT